MAAIDLIKMISKAMLAPTEKRVTTAGETPPEASPWLELIDTKIGKMDDLVQELVQFTKDISKNKTIKVTLQEPDQAFNAAINKVIGENISKNLEGVTSHLQELSKDVIKASQGGGGTEEAAKKAEEAAKAEAKAQKEKEESIKKTEAKSLSALENIQGAAKGFLSTMGTIFGTFLAIELSLSNIGGAFQSLDTMAGKLFVQFQAGRKELEGAFKASADAASMVGESLDTGIEAFNALRKSGVRSLDQINETLGVSASAVLTIGGDIVEWGHLLGQVQYNIQLTSGQMKSLMRVTTLVQKQFALTTGETQELLEVTSDISEEMYRLGHAGAAAMANITKALGAAKAFRAGDTIEKSLRAMTSAKEFFESEGQTQLLLYRAASKGLISINDILSGRMAGSNKAFKALSLTLEDIYKEASGITNEFAQQRYLAIYGIRGMNELKKSWMAMRVAATSFAEKQEQVAKIMDKFRSGAVSETVAKAEIQMVLGKKVEGELMSATSQLLKNAKLQEQAQKAAASQDVVNKLAEAIASENQGLPGRFSDVLHKLQKQNTKLFEGIDLSGSQEEILRQLEQNNINLQEQAKIANKALEEQRKQTDPILALKKQIAGPLNELLQTLARGILYIVDVMGPTGIKLLSGLALGVAGLGVILTSISAALKVKKGIGGLLGALTGKTGGIAAKATETVEEAVTGSMTGGPVGGKGTSFLGGIIENLKKIGTKDAIEASKVAMLLIPVGASLATVVYLFNKATKGMDVGAFLAGITGTAALGAMVYSLSKIPLDKINLKTIGVGLLKMGGVILALSLLAIPMMILQKAYSGVDTKAISRQMVGLSLALLAMIPPLAILTLFGTVVEGISSAALTGLLGAGATFLGLAALALPLVVFQAAFSSLDMGKIANQMLDLSYSLLTMSGALAILAVVGGTIEVVGPLALVGLAAAAATFAALSLLAGPIYLFQKAFSGVDGAWLAKTMFGLAIGIASLAVIGYALAASAGIIFMAPMVAIGVAGAVVVLGALSVLGGAMTLAQAALSGVDGIGFAKTMGGIGVGMLGLAFAGASLIVLALFGSVGPLLVAGIYGAISVLGALSVMAPVMIAAQASLSAVDGIGFAKTMAGIGLGLLALAVIGGVLAVMGVGLLAAPFILAGIWGSILLLKGLGVLADSLRSFQGAFTGLDTKSLAKQLEGVNEILEVLSSGMPTSMEAGLLGGLGWIMDIVGLGPASGVERLGEQLASFGKLADPLRTFSESFKGVEVSSVSKNLGVLQEIVGMLSEMAETFSGGWFSGGAIGRFWSSIELPLLLANSLEIIAKSSIGKSIVKISNSFSGLSEKKAKEISGGFQALGSLMNGLKAAEKGGLSNLTKKGGWMPWNWNKLPSRLDNIKKGLDGLAGSKIGASISKLIGSFGHINRYAAKSVKAGFEVLGSVLSALTTMPNTLAGKSGGGLGSAISGGLWGVLGYAIDWWNSDSGEENPKTVIDKFKESIDLLTNAGLGDQINKLIKSFSGEGYVNTYAAKEIVKHFGVVSDVARAISNTGRSLGLLMMPGVSSLNGIIASLDDMAGAKLGTHISALIKSLGGVADEEVEGVRRTIEALSQILPLTEKMNQLRLEFKNGNIPVDAIKSSLEAITRAQLGESITKLTASITPVASKKPMIKTPIEAPVEVPTNIDIGDRKGMDSLLSELQAIRAAVESMDSNGIKVNVNSTTKTTKAPTKRPRTVKAGVGI